jgi:hypothetical protein
MWISAVKYYKAFGTADATRRSRHRRISLHVTPCPTPVRRDAAAIANPAFTTTVARPDDLDVLVVSGEAQAGPVLRHVRRL